MFFTVKSTWTEKYFGGYCRIPFIHHIHRRLIEKYLTLHLSHQQHKHKLNLIDKRLLCLICYFNRS